jgi:hypothetical protein
MRTLVGNCAQPLEHRGPVQIRNTHTDVEVPPEGEPGLTICTSRANDQLPDPPPVALYVECGESVFQDVHIEGDTIIDGTVIVNDCIIFNSGAIFNGPTANRRRGYSSTIVRFCLTGEFDGITHCATARVMAHDQTGSCYPDYSSGSTVDCPGGTPEITVVDRGNRFTPCNLVGNCGYAAYFSDDSVSSECDDTCDSPGGGVYEVLHMDQSDDEFNTCYVDVVTNLCCINGSLVVCKKRVNFPYPVKVGGEDCGGSGSVCT